MPRAMVASIAGSAEAGWTPIKAAVRTVPPAKSLDQIPGCCKAPLTIDLVSLDLGEPGGVEDPQEILGFPETSAGGRGLRGLWIAMRRYRVEEQLPGDVFGRRRPARERHPSIPPQDSPRLGQDRARGGSRNSRCQRRTRHRQTAALPHLLLQNGSRDALCGRARSLPRRNQVPWAWRRAAVLRPRRDRVRRRGPAPAFPRQPEQRRAHKPTPLAANQDARKREPAAGQSS
jgi:hypothetical protein